jgi:DNA invertase Pin-like site-specific DNA recombinase
MPESNSTNGRGTPEPAATYYRMSKDEQEHSVERQRSQVLPYAARCDYAVAEEYVDEGIPGWKGEEERDAFARLLRDAARGKFKVILCDDVDRFGRLDLHEYGEAVQKCRRAGVRLETVAQGPIDWDEPMLQVSDAIRMVFKRQQSSDTSRRILTRFVLMARQGIWAAGRPPHGYRKDRATGHLVPGPESERRVVEWLFKTYAEKVVSLRWLADELYRRGVRSPGGRDRWSPQSIQKLLRNRNYLGDLHWNAVSKGRFQETDGTAVIRRKAKGGRRRPPAEMIVVLGSHPALVDRDVFEKVGAKLKGNRERTTPLPGGGDYLLNGLMVCGHCGSRMVGRKGFNRDAADRRPVYICNGYNRWGKAHCGCHWVRESEALDAVVGRLQEDFLNPENVTRLRAEIERQAEEDRRSAPEAERRLRKEITGLDDKIAKGNRNLALADPQDMPGISQAVREWRQERDRLAAELAAGAAAPAPALAEVDLAEAELWRLREGLQDDDPAAVRAVLRECVEKVELWWDHRAKGRFTKAVFSRGLIHLKVSDALSHTCPFHQWSGTGTTTVAPAARRRSPACSAQRRPSASARPSPPGSFVRRISSRSRPS